MGERYLRIGDLTDKFPISRATIYRMVKNEQMPKPVKFGSSSVWKESEINQWAKKCEDAR